MDAETRLRFVSRISEQTRRLIKIVEELFQLSRFESYASENPTVKAIDLKLVAREAIEMRSQLAVDRDIKVNLMMEGDSHTVDGDPEALQQLTVNLLDNALKYSPAQSTVEVRLVRREDMVSLIVSDQGPGIADVHKQRVFERFYRIDPARSREQGGTGLGLSIVKNIAASHHGHVQLTSEVGQGATFTVSFPASGAA